MRHLRGLVMLMAIAVAAQTLFDRCLLVCHDTPSGSVAHCHETDGNADDLRLIDASGCDHGHDQSWVATTDVGSQSQTSVVAGLPVAIASGFAERARPLSAARIGLRTVGASNSSFLRPLRL